MNVTNVTKDDVLNAQRVFNALKAGKFEISGPDIAALSSAINWLAVLGVSIGKVYQSENAPEKLSVPPPPPPPSPPPLLAPSLLNTKPTKGAKRKK